MMGFSTPRRRDSSPSTSSLPAPNTNEPLTTRRILPSSSSSTLPPPPPSMPPPSTTRRRKRKRNRGVAAMALLLVAGSANAITFDIISHPSSDTAISNSPSQVPTVESSSEPPRTGSLPTASATRPASPSPSPLVFGTRAGYDQPGGHDPMCWRTTFDNNNNQVDMELLNSCGPHQALRVWEPDETESERLGIEEEHDYRVHVELDLRDFGVAPQETGEEGPLQLLSHQAQQQSAPSLALRVLFCRVGQVTFCSPFVPEQAERLALEDDGASESESRTQRPYFASDWIPVPVGENAVVNETIAVPTVVEEAGSYFVLATLRFVTADRHDSQPHYNYQWDMANGLDPHGHGGRVVRYRDPPEIMHVSRGARITSYVAVALASCVLLGLLHQTVLHRKNQVLHLSQVGFLVLFLVAALLATTSAVLLEPKNDLYCRLATPMTLVPLQLMYAITFGRLWRINTVISPLLVEHFRKNLKSQRWTGKLVSWVHRQTGSSKRNVQLRRTVTSRRLAFVIAVFAVPQLVLQAAALVWQPQEHTVRLDGSGWQGVVQCRSTNVEHPLGNILYYAYGALILLLLLLLIMAYSCRNLPSLFNETHVIYTIIFRTFVFIVFGITLTIILQSTQQNAVIAPDIAYLLKLTVILYTTLASSLGLLWPKLQMIYKGEVVIVSKLVSDHHRARREKQAQKHQHHQKGGLGNVTGIDLSQSGHSYSGYGSHTNDSYLQGSFNTEAYLNGSTLDGSLTNRGDFGGDGSFHTADKSHNKPSKLSDIRERSAASTASLPNTISAHSESSNSWVVRMGNTASDLEDVALGGDDELGDDEDYDGFAESSCDEGGAITNSSSKSPPRLMMGDWKGRMKSIRDKWTSKSTPLLVAETPEKDANNKNERRTSSEVLPTTSTATDIDLEAAEDNNNVEAATTTAPDQTRGTTAYGRRRREDRLKRQRSRKRKSSMIMVSPDETPPRRLVLKMVDQQDCLTAITTKIMSGLSVRPDEWDKLVRLHTILEKCLQEEVSFTWKVQQQRQRSQKQLPQFDRASSVQSLNLEDIENAMKRGDSVKHLEQPEDDDHDHHSAGGNSRDATLRRGNARPSVGGKFFKLSHVAKEFRRVVDCRDRKYGLTTYPHCFIGCDAVDSMLYAGLVESREEAVELARRLAEELHLFKHVTGDHSFKDEKLFYEFYLESDSDDSSFHGDDDEMENDTSIQLFDICEKSAHAEARAFREAVTVRDRWYHLKLYPKVFVGCEAIDALIYHGVAKTRWEAVQLGRRLARETKLFRHVAGDHELRDEWLFYRFSDLDENGVESSLGSALSDSGRPRSAIAELADAFEMYVDIRDRWYHARKYYSCFIGSEAVDAMIYAGLVETREEAVALGQRLQKELRLFHHACHEHDFKDEYLFYQLRQRGAKLGGSSRGESYNNRSRSGGASALDDSTSSNHDKLGLSLNSGSHGEKQSKFSNLLDKEAAFRHCAVVTTGTWRMKKYPNVFIGCETVDRMVYSGLAKSRMEAVQLGRALAREMKLFRHVANDHGFSDDYLFYRFRSDNDSSAGCVSALSKNSVNIASPPQNVKTASGEISELSQSINHNSFSSSYTGRSALAEKADLFRKLAKVKDRKYRLMTYKSCFVGQQMVDALVKAGVVETREAAVEYGRELEDQLRLFQHVTGAHSFQDSYLFYRFRDFGFKEGFDVLGTSLNSANEMSVSSIGGCDYSKSDLDSDVLDAMGGGPGGRRFGLPVLDENSELDAAANMLHTRTQPSMEVDLADSLPALMEYGDVDERVATDVPEEPDPNSKSTDASSSFPLPENEAKVKEAISLDLTLQVGSHGEVAGMNLEEQHLDY